VVTPEEAAYIEATFLPTPEHSPSVSMEYAMEVTYTTQPVYTTEVTATVAINACSQWENLTPFPSATPVADGYKDESIPEVTAGSVVDPSESYTTEPTTEVFCKTEVTYHPYNNKKNNNDNSNKDVFH